MSLETDLVALLNPLAPNRVWWYAAPEGARITATTILLHHASGRGRTGYVEQAVSDTVHGRVRVCVISPDVQAACDVARLVEKAICATEGLQAHAYGGFSVTYFQELKQHETRQDFGILYADP